MQIVSKEGKSTSDNAKPEAMEETMELDRSSSLMRIDRLLNIPYFQPISILPSVTHVRRLKRKGLMATHEYAHTLSSCGFVECCSCIANRNGKMLVKKE